MTANNKIYQKALDRLNNEQRQAVDHIEGPVLVIAGPGTGKTQLLTLRIGQILRNSDTTPANILCLTYSEAGRVAMKERLSKLIGRPGAEVTISTYHAFGNELIRSYPDLFDLAPGSRPADELALDRLTRKILSELDYDNPLKNDIYLKDIKTLIGGFKRALITPNTLKEVCHTNLIFAKEIDQIINDIIDPTIKMSKALISKYAQLFEVASGLNCPSINDVTPVKQVFIEQLEQALTTAQDNNNTPALTAWKNKWLEKDSSNRFRLQSPRVIRRLLAFADIYQLYNDQLEKEKLFDYDDMILIAIEGIETNLDLKYSLQEKYQYIQLDEFQDTNEAQFKLVKLLSDNPVNEERPNILAVGDDDQAIYSFQGAHYSHMERFYYDYRDVKLINLKQNYRSGTEIINFSRGLREQINEKLNLLPKVQKAFELNKPQQILRVDLNLDNEHLAWTANYVHSLIDKGESPQSIAIFAPKHQMLEEIIPYLHAKQIAISYERKDDILKDPLINNLLTCCRLVCALEDSDNISANNIWPEVLSYEYQSLPTELIWQLSATAKQTYASWTELLLNDPKTRNIALFYIRLSQISSYTSLETMISYLLGTADLLIEDNIQLTVNSKFYSYYFDNREGNEQWRLPGRLNILISKMREINEDFLTIRDMLEFTDGHLAAHIKISDNYSIKESEQSINLMSAHSAKGLEFESVILINFCDHVWGHSAQDQPSKITLPSNLAHIRIDNNNDDEKLRLLFVAASRAKTRLVMVGYKKTVSGKSAKKVVFLDESDNPEGSFNSKLLPRNKNTILTPDIDNIPVINAAHLWFDRHLDFTATERRDFLNAKLNKFNLTASKLNSYTNVINEGPKKFFIDSILGFPRPKNVAGAYGSAIHATLDWEFKNSIAKKDHKPLLEDIMAHFEFELRKAKLNQLEYTQNLKRGFNALGFYFPNNPIPIDKHDLSEESININLDGIRLGGKIDRMLINVSAKTIVIVDFKTGSSYSKWGSDVKSYHNQRQLYFYKFLVENSPRFKGYKVEAAKIQFIEPNPDSSIPQSLTLKFKSEEEQKLSELIKVVWEMIMRLDFPDTTKYKKSVAGIKQFENVLLEK